MKVSRPLAFVVLAFVIGATISQASFAFADDSTTNPFRAIWQAISELQSKTESLQAQIDDLREQRGTAAVSGQQETRVSDPSIAIDVGSDVGQTVIKMVAKNSGPENAVGVKLSAYYQMTLLHVNSIQGADCTDQARGIIECYLGTIEAGSETIVKVNATPAVLGQQAIITGDMSSITGDANPANNHAEAVFTTSEAPVVIQPAMPLQVSPQVPAQNQAQSVENQTQSQPPQEQPQNQAQSSETVVQQPQNQTQTQPVEQQHSQDQTQAQSVENQTQSQPPQEQPPAEQSQPPSGAQQSDQGSADSGSSGSSSSNSGESGTSGGESSPPPPSGGSEPGATG